MRTIVMLVVCLGGAFVSDHLYNSLPAFGNNAAFLFGAFTIFVAEGLIAGIDEARRDNG